MKPAAGRNSAARAMQLQRKIFTRWVNQKVMKRGLNVDDVVTAVGDGTVLIALMEVLSEKKYTGKALRVGSQMRVHKIDNINNALNFVWQCGVQTKVKPSAENLVDNDEKSILGLVWAIMDKFLKNVDEETGEQLNVKDGLLKWCQVQTKGYEGVSIDNVTSSFHSGLALCALIHKHRPELIDWYGLPKGDNHKVLQTALDAAEQAFGMEKFLTPEDIPILNESSMLVYLNDYYYGIAQWKKVDQAANRISKLIKTAKVNDNMKTQYLEKASGLITWVDAAYAYLNDRSIDFTYEGAKKSLSSFYEFKSHGNVNMLQLKLESLYNNLVVKLAYNHRPEFIPPAGLRTQDIAEKMKILNNLFHEKRIFLHNELNRQIRLSKLADQHQMRYNKLSEWLNQKRQWLDTDHGEFVDSVNEALLLLRKLDSLEKESDKIYKTSFSTVQRDIEVELKALKIMFAAQRQYFQKEAQKAKHKRLIGELTERMPRIGEDDEKSIDQAEEAAIADLKKKFFVSSKSTITLKDIGTELRNERYENSEEIEKREKEIEDIFHTLWEKTKMVRPRFEKLVEREQVKEKLRIELSRVASEFLLWAHDTIDRVDSDTNFGFTLTQVDVATLTKELDDSDQDLRVEAGERQLDYRRVIKKLQEYGQDTKYMSTEKELDAAVVKLNEALLARRERYNKEVERQKLNDNACQEFATVAEEFHKWILTEIEKISLSGDTLEAQLEKVEKEIWRGSEKHKTLKTIEEIQTRLTALGVANNPYTTLSYEDLTMQWAQFSEFLSQKKSAVEEQIIVTKYRGISAEQIREIEKSFALYDTNKDGFVDRKELKQCLYSLGEELEMTEIENMMDLYGERDRATPVMSLAKFKEMMITLYGDTGKREEIIESFQFLSKGEEDLSPAVTERALCEADREYFYKTATKNEKGNYDYRAWTDAIFEMK